MLVKYSPPTPCMNSQLPRPNLMMNQIASPTLTSGGSCSYSFQFFYICMFFPLPLYPFSAFESCLYSSYLPKLRMHTIWIISPTKEWCKNDMKDLKLNKTWLLCLDVLQWQKNDNTNLWKWGMFRMPWHNLVPWITFCGKTSLRPSSFLSSW